MKRGLGHETTRRGHDVTGLGHETTRRGHNAT